MSLLTSLKVLAHREIGEVMRINNVKMRIFHWQIFSECENVYKIH